MKKRIKDEIRRNERKIDKQLTESYREDEEDVAGVLIPSPRADIKKSLVEKYKKAGWQVKLKEDIHGGKPRTIFILS